MKSLPKLICLCINITLLFSLQIKDQVKDKSSISTNMQIKSNNKNKYLQCPCAELAPPCCSPEFQTVSILFK